MSTSERLTAIVRERYETGAHGNAFLMMSKAATDTIPRPEPRPYELPPSALLRLWDIPVILDAALPVGAWRLLDRTTGEEIESEGVPRTWAQAIEALRAEDAAIRAELTDSKGRFDWESYDPAYDLAADYLTDRTTALTEEGQ